MGTAAMILCLCVYSVLFGFCFEKKKKKKDLNNTHQKKKKNMKGLLWMIIMYRM